MVYSFLDFSHDVSIDQATQATHLCASFLAGTPQSGMEQVHRKRDHRLPLATQHSRIAYNCDMTIYCSFLKQQIWYIFSKLKNMDRRLSKTKRCLTGLYRPAQKL
jgi:hypothetical protein